MKLGSLRTDPLTGEQGIVRTKRKHCAIARTPGGRLFKVPFCIDEWKRIAQRRYRGRA